MASHSPIVLNSSSQASFRVPSLTPQSHRKASKPATSSSPGLEDLPSFAKVPAKGLKSGSHAQKLPEGAASGFASAASLWKTQQRFEARFYEIKPQHENTTIESNHRENIKSNGKLSKPKKTQKPAKDRKQTSEECRSPSIRSLDDYRNTTFGKDALSKTGPVKTRTPSLSLSEYDFRPEEHQESPVPKPVQTKPEKKARRRTAKEDQTPKDETFKKPRKPAAKAADSKKDAATKKPKKRLAKSESIILNSDEPDPIDENISVPAITTSARDDTSKIDKMEIETKRSETPSKNLSAFEYTVQKEIEPTFDDKSTYFFAAARGNNNENVVDEKTSGRTSPKPSPAFSNKTASPTPFIAPRRRLSWTPLKNTIRTATTPIDRPGTASSTGSGAPAKSLASLVSGFGYSEQPAESQPHERAANGEALTKRRRIELAEVSTVAPSKRKPAQSEPSEPTKKPPKVKKKPQTITALATKAYQNEPEVASAQPVVSEFFPAAQPTVPHTNENPNAAQECAKPKKPRKPRAKKADDKAPGQSTKKAAKAKKGKVKFNESDYIAKLYTPDEARAQEQSQDFVFGTSSQLAVEESPTFIREMQAAVRESEVMPGIQSCTGLQAKSSIQVPSAPHGTNLSVGQADSGHWSSAARDVSGDCLQADAAFDGSRSRDMTAVTGQTTSLSRCDAAQADFEHPSESEQIDTPQEHHLADPRKMSKEDVIPDMDLRECRDNSPIDLCLTSPVVENVEQAVDGDIASPKAEEPVLAGETAVEPETMARSPLRHNNNEGYAFLSSDDSLHRAADVIRAPVAISPVFEGLSAASKTPQLKRSATSPSLHRTALQSLDANVGLLSHTSPMKGVESVQHRALTTSAPVEQPKRPRGRPRKNASPVSAATPPPKRRGRPPKAAPGPGVPPVSPRARSTKASTKASGLGVSASQPTTSAEWMNIDEISDSDSPSTPSPPRQRAGSSPPAIAPLDVAVTASPSLAAKAPAAATSTLKINDPGFAAIQEELSSRITVTVKSTPPSTDLKNPTWHEKILLYDPIVLEDLTAWLNDQGLRVETQRLKPKPKARGRKKKDAPPEEPEYETVKEELKPWMVQRWCEEKSICCLWKEGLRGGVRTRY